MKPVPPLTATEFEITRRCNFSCVHCYHDPSRRGEDELGFDDVESVLDGLAAAGVLHLTFTGGEPFARGDFPRILESARERRFAPSVITNGSFLDGETVSWLGHLKIHRLAVTLAGMSDKTFGEVTGRPEAAGGVLTGIERARRAGLPLELHVPLLRENFADLEEFISFGKELGVPVKLSPRVSPREGGNLEPLAHEIPADALGEFVSVLELSCLRPRAGEPDALCPVGMEMLAISASGEVMPCIGWRTVLGVVPQDDIGEIWSTSAELSRLRNLKRSDYPECAACGLFENCHLCPGVGAALDSSASPGIADPVACRLTRGLAESGHIVRRRPDM